MKQISEMEEKNVHVVFKYLSKACCIKNGVVGTPLLSFKDDVTVILLFFGSFM
jgi:hypothetical protein